MSEWKFIATGLLVFVVAIAAVVVGGYLWKRAECMNRWERSGYLSEYRFIGGCMVRRHDGTWLPAGNLRDIQL